MSHPFTALVAALCGWSITGLIGGTRNPLERWGLSVLVGMAVTTAVMFLVGLVGLPIRPLIYIPVVALSALDGVRRIWRGDGGWSGAAAPTGADAGPAPRLGSLLASRHPIVGFVLIAIIAWLVVIMVYRCVYLPNRLYDSITSFDLLGRIIAAENVFRVSVFGHTDLARGGGSYPPFTALMFAWGYQTGLRTANQALILPLLGYLMWLFGFARRRLGATSSWALVTLCLLSPDFYAYMHLPLTNLPVAVFASPGILYLMVAVRGDRPALVLAALGLAVVVWCRADAAVFVVGATVALWMHGRRATSLARRLLLPAPALAVLGLWQLYSIRALGSGAGDRLSSGLFWDGDRIRELVVGAGKMLLDPHTMGFAVWMFVVGVGSVIAMRSRRSDGGPLIVATAVSLLVYTIFFYQVDPVRQAPLASLLESTYRRGLVAFVPLMWISTLLSPAGARVRQVGGALLRPS